MFQILLDSTEPYKKKPKKSIFAGYHSVTQPQTGEFLELWYGTWYRYISNIEWKSYLKKYHVFDLFQWEMHVR